MLVDDEMDNGVGWAEYQPTQTPLYGATVPLAARRCDNVQKVILSGAQTALFGSLEFRLSGGAGALTILASTCIDSQVSMPYTTYAGTPFPDTFYIWALPGSVDQETNVLVELVYRDSNGFEAVVDEFSLTIAPGLGAPSYFPAVNDYISEHGVNCYIGSKGYSALVGNPEGEQEDYFIVASRRPGLQLTAVDARAGDHYRVSQVAAAYPTETIIVNGLYFNSKDYPSEISQEALGYLICNASLSPISSYNYHWGFSEGYVGQKQGEVLEFDVGRIPDTSIGQYAMAIGGMPLSYFEDAQVPGGNASTFIGLSTAGEDLVFVGMGAGFLGRSGQHNAFLTDCLDSQVSGVGILRLDGGASRALVVRPNGDQRTLVKGARHSRLADPLVSSYVNSYICLK